MRTWLEEHEYESLKQAMGSMSLERSPNPAAFERANYMKVLAAYQMADWLGARGWGLGARGCGR